MIFLKIIFMFFKFVFAGGVFLWGEGWYTRVLCPRLPEAVVSSPGAGVIRCCMLLQVGDGRPLISTNLCIHVHIDLHKHICVHAYKLIFTLLL